MVQHLAVYRDYAPGFEAAFPMLSAPQIGVRHARRLIGAGTVTREGWSRGVPNPDEIGVSPSLAPQYPAVSVPYGALVPAALDGLLVAGWAISCDATSHSFLREVPQCWLTGQAARTAAALAVAQCVAPRAVAIERLEEELVRQGALVRAGVEAVALAPTASSTCSPKPASCWTAPNRSRRWLRWHASAGGRRLTWPAG